MSLRNLAFAIPGALDRRTGGTLYDRRLIKAMQDAKVAVDLLSWGSAFPHPTADDLLAAAAELAALPDGTTAIIDGLAYGAMPDIAELHAERLKLVALVHHPLELETGLDRPDRQRLMQSERRALAVARAVIATSRATADRLERDYGVPRRVLAVAIPGIDPVAPAPPSRHDPNEVPGILAVGAVSPRKGYDVLVRSLSALRGQSWHCRIVGSLEQAPAAVAALRAQIAGLGLDGRVELAGTLSPAALQAAHRHACLFVASSHHEGYGMAIAEALQHGLPVIATDGCAIAHEVPECSLLMVPAGDAVALTGALELALGDAPLRHRLASAAAAATAALPSWASSAAGVVEFLSRL